MMGWLYAHAWLNKQGNECFIRSIVLQILSKNVGKCKQAEAIYGSWELKYWINIKHKDRREPPDASDDTLNERKLDWGVRTSILEKKNV